MMFFVVPGALAVSSITASTTSITIDGTGISPATGAGIIDKYLVTAVSNVPSYSGTEKLVTEDTIIGGLSEETSYVISIQSIKTGCVQGDISGDEVNVTATTIRCKFELIMGTVISTHSVNFYHQVGILQD